MGEIPLYLSRDVRFALPSCGRSPRRVRECEGRGERNFECGGEKNRKSEITWQNATFQRGGKAPRI